jgi:hypothetical protein
METEETEEYDGYMQTYSGMKFYPLSENFDYSKILLVDIAHALSQICRYAGHTNNFYSVAEHSMVMAKLFPEHKKIALLHDAAEAYFGDLPRPIKNAIPAFKYHEHNLLSHIFNMAGIAFNEDTIALIEQMDLMMLALERKSVKIMNGMHLSWGSLIDSIDLPDYDFNCYPPRVAKDLFHTELKAMNIPYNL